MGITRRGFLLSGTLGWASTALGHQPPRSEPESPRCGMGLVEYALGNFRKHWKQQARNPDSEPLALLRETQRLGAGGIQTTLIDLDAEQIRAFRNFADEHRLHVEANLAPPRAETDLERFTAQVRLARQAGATLARTVILPGRRYEQFRSLEEFRAAEQQGEAMLRRAEPVLARAKFRLAVENHKDQRSEERVALFRRLNSEWIGACVDLGNNLTLLESPRTTVEALLPWTLTVHIKDQAVRSIPDGFEYADVALGEGILELPELARRIRQARPDVKFNLEVITRDPLRVPVLTEEYWRTMPQVPGRDLAEVLRLVRARSAPRPFPAISQLSPEAQRVAERDQIARSVRYARETLGL